MKKINLFQIFSFLLFLLISGHQSVRAQIITPFASVYQVTQKGGIVYLANSSLGCSQNPASSAVSSSCASGSAQMPPGGTFKDNDYASAYIDIDGDPSTIMSSSDSLNLPLCSEVTRAYLFWGASGASTPSFTTCKMKINNGAYQTITAAVSQTNTIGFNTYHCYADVTTLLQSGGIRSRVTVADIRSSSLGLVNTFGSWCIAVVYKNDLKTMRQLTVFRGLANVSSSAPTVNVPITGFLTPLTGPVSLEVGLYVHDGDRASTGDNLNFRGAASFIPLTNAVNAANDIMNSTVSYGGTLTPFRVPNMNNTSGLDADIFIPNNTTKNYIGNSATTATFQMTTGGETYLPQMVTTAIDVYEPDLRASIKARDVNGGALVPGDIVEYRIKGVNIGSDPSLNTFITDTLDLRANYIPNSTRIIFGAVTGTMTDVSGDDLVDFNPLNRTLRIRIGAGANAVTGGSVINTPAGIDSTIITYSVICTSSCIKIGCYPFIDARAFIWGTGSTSNNNYNSGSNPGIFDNLGCPIPGTTSSPITASTCSSPVASNNGPGCVGFPVSLFAPTDTDASYSWSGPAAFSSTLQNPGIPIVASNMAGLYTVTMAISGSTCNAIRTTSLIVGICTPTAVNDFTNIVANTPVTGNAAANDLNLTAPVFSVTTAPANGTLTMNPATGQYTFIPATNFTGVTTATYAVCNTTYCSSAQITFSIFPNLVASPDQIGTTPTQTLSGNLLQNDAGTTGTLTATYSVSISTLNPATGSLTLNPSTGQYTFTPNPAFTGTTQLSYTVCNTAVNPTICSNSSVTISIFPVPQAQNDFTTTVTNTPVQGNAAINDSGVAGATFSITNPPANGTISINPTSGQYTYTPPSGFTGVASATYQLCNAALATCSTAVITTTVYPLLVANMDIILTTPSVSVQGNLLSNDLGISPTLTATYSISITQLPASVGTLVINPATGQYTFVPNPSYTGSPSTNYTVCNTSVNAPQCSSGLIRVEVAPPAAPVNDFTTSIINTPVTGNAAVNDNTVTSLSNYSLIAQSPGGTYSLNPVSGQYTFTPANGFTGISTATYQLCNGVLSPNCATAVITISVYPTLAAGNDTVIALPNTGTTGSLATNDAGVLLSGSLTGTYIYSVSALNPSIGVLSINPATGQYTFTPAGSFSGSTSTTYTVCNTSVNPQICSTATIFLIVGGPPVAQADQGRTLINTPVTGTASANDINAQAALLPNYTVSQPLPGTGTLTMNATTGVYSYTPATGFTGTTAATYTLCNLLSPPCSTTQITFSVYPSLSAQSDQLNTVPNTTVSGNLLTNDAGIVNNSTLTATYSVSVTQPASSTGTFVVNPASGQYTFIPNPAFTGTAISTYTVCNTSVSPQVCSTASIAINVLPTPAPVNDFTTAIVNGTIVANAGSNDGGTALGSFSILTQPAGGTITMNASSGQYTFVASPGFTGVTTATYNLCNGAPVTCSTAVITITVFPALAANPDQANTGPGLSTNGNLLSNDAGVISGGQYSVSVSPLSASTGTLLVNPATGQYTFIPNPAFTGTTLTTYTVCNTSVNPQVCSTSTIIIRVLPQPAPVNDFTTTISNTTVSGNAGSNDGGTISGTFSITGPPANGTITMNAATGQYTFTPAPSFTGVTTATYNLCNGAPVTCSTAVITITVYPALAANSDQVNTGPGLSTNGNLLSNDAGVISGGQYSVSASPLSASSGTLLVNPATGQYTFIPNPAFTGTTLSTYTVCNTSVNPQVCSTATIILGVFPSPAPVNDATTTIINTSVTGNAASNDGGTAFGTFTITGAPANGTITMNAATGQYTFTPAQGFTGVTTATYNLCNGAPSTCSAAIITITVYPALVANADAIGTGPGITVNGSLLANDGGVISGGQYSVTVSPISPTSGTLLVNPATGQYTFIPNPSFTGSTQTTYTVCNTSVNPQVCSSTTIVLGVFPQPVPVNDATTTVANIPVTGDASLNDGGVLFGTFTITGAPANGTITMNPVTGQYTFTPAQGFTGVTTATYNLCNGAPTTCSPAVITITVYPDLIAVNDVINTGPGSPASGNLLTNDAGIIPGGSYTVSVTPLSAGVGTLNFNPATGQYTFIPAPGFTGSTSTTYTVCNTSVNPQICSTATIVINVLPNPVPVNDATLTLINTPVSGDLSSNDGGVSGGTYSIVTQPSGGTLTLNPANGQYTFVPASGFTGITTATYVLCNGAPVTCSTAVVTITVYPQLQAVNDVTVTALNTPVSGILIANDFGLVSYGNYSVTISPPSGNSGTLQINPGTGQYTFIPASGFTGTSVSTYTICQYTGTVQLQCSTASLVIIVGSRSAIGIAKQLTNVNYQQDGTADLSYRFTLKNLGNQDLTQVEVLDDLILTFPSPASFTIISGPALKTPLGSQITVNGAYDGKTNTRLTLANTSSLAVGRTDTLVFTVKLNHNGVPGVFNNTANVTAVGNGTTVSDTSVDGADPDPDGDNDAGFNFSPTSFTCQPVKIGLAKSAGATRSLGGGCYEVAFKFTVKNFGQGTIYNVRVGDQLEQTFSGASSFSVVSAPESSRGFLIPDATFSGTGSFTNLCTAASSLAANASDTLFIKVAFCMTDVRQFTNTATASGSSLPGGGFMGSDTSCDGNNPDPDNNNLPDESSGTPFGPEPDLFIPEGFSPNNDGVNDVLVIRGMDQYPENEVRILNRWGNTVYRKKQYDNTWDGTANQGVTFGSNALPEGTYFYIIDLGNGQKARTGYIYLNRAAK